MDWDKGEMVAALRADMSAGAYDHAKELGLDDGSGDGGQSGGGGAKGKKRPRNEAGNGEARDTPAAKRAKADRVAEKESGGAPLRFSFAKKAKKNKKNKKSKNKKNKTEALGGGIGGSSGSGSGSGSIGDNAKSAPKAKAAAGAAVIFIDADEDDYDDAGGRGVVGDGGGRDDDGDGDGEGDEDAAEVDEDEEEALRLTAALRQELEEGSEDEATEGKLYCPTVPVKGDSDDDSQDDALTAAVAFHEAQAMTASAKKNVRYFAAADGSELSVRCKNCGQVGHMARYWLVFREGRGGEKERKRERKKERKRERKKERKRERRKERKKERKKEREKERKKERLLTPPPTHPSAPTRANSSRAFAAGSSDTTPPRARRSSASGAESPGTSPPTALTALARETRSVCASFASTASGRGTSRRSVPTC